MPYFGSKPRQAKRLPIPDATTLDSTLDFLISELTRVGKATRKTKTGVTNYGKWSAQFVAPLSAFYALRKYLGGEAQLHSITDEVLQKFVDDELDRGITIGAVVRYQFSIRQRMLMYGVPLKYPKHPAYTTKAKPGIIDKATYGKMLLDRNFRGNLRRWVILAVNCGLRGNEIGLLQKRAIDFEDGYLYVEADISKNERRRRIPIPPDALQVLREVFLNPVRPAEPTTTFGELTCKAGVKWQWNAYRKKSGLNLERINFHKLRHTWVSWMLADGIPIYEVMDWAGHKNINTTLNYAHHLGINDDKMRSVFSQENIRRSL